MACRVSIKKNMGSFSLDMHFQTEAKRLGILGESGAGKSMCLKAIAGILKPDEGEIYIGENCVFSKERKLNLPPQKRKTLPLKGSSSNCSLTKVASPSMPLRRSVLPQTI